jgi:hypothetical protein
MEDFEKELKQKEFYEDTPMMRWAIMRFRFKLERLLAIKNIT